jgi:hypothetical protein
MAISQIAASVDVRNQPQQLFSTTVQPEQPKQLMQAEFPIELLFPLLIVFAFAFIGVEKAKPRDTDDIYQPDLDRQAARKARQARRAKVKWAK